MDAIKQYMMDLGAVQMNDRQQERELWDAMLAGRQAREQLILSVLPYAINRAKAWRRTARAKGVCMEDLIGWANEAVVETVDNSFDPNRGRLTTILSIAIWQKLQRKVFTDSCMIRVPVYQTASNVKENRFSQEAKAAIGGAFPLDEATDAPGHIMKPDDAAEFREELIDRIKHATAYGYDKRNVRIFIEYMTTEQTLEELGEQFDVSRERVRQIVDTMFHVLRREKQLNRPKQKHMAIDDEEEKEDR